MHVIQQSDDELRQLARVLLKLGRLVVEQIRDAIEALIEGKGALARMVQRREAAALVIELVEAGLFAIAHVDLDGTAAIVHGNARLQVEARFKGKPA